MHAQTRRGLVVALGFVAAAALTGIVGPGHGWWLPLHLFVVGGLLSAISATTQMLAVTWSTAPAPRKVVAATQRWTLACGALVLVIGRESDRMWMFVGGAITVIIAMVGLGVILLHIRQHAITDRFAPAIEAYVAAVIAGCAGMALGLWIGTGRAGARALELRGAHLVLNVFGLVGLVIAGTLPYFTATQVRSKMSPRATASTMRATFAVLAAGTVAAAVGQIVGGSGIAAVGLTGYAFGLSMIAALLPMYTRSRLQWAGPRAWQLLAGLAWWTAMTLALALTIVRRSEDRAVLQALMIGGFAQILVASLAYLGPVLRGGGHERLSAGFASTRSWVSLAAGNIAACAALVGSGPVVAIALAIWLTDLMSRAIPLMVHPSNSVQV